MLGLGLGIDKSYTTLVDTLLASYSSNFVDSIDNWIAIGIEDDNDDLTLEYNQPFNGTPGWLKCTYAEDQVSDGGIRMNASHSTWAPAGGLIGDYIVYSYTIYLDDASKWGSDDVRTDVKVLEKIFYNEVAPETVTYVFSEHSTAPEELVIDENDYHRNAPNIKWTKGDDEPLAGAIFYVKDIEVKLYRPL